MTCRYPTCSKRAREAGTTYARRFCSTACELKFEHIRADAREQRLDEQRRHRP